MGDGLRDLLEHTLLGAVIVAETEGARDIEREIALAIGGADLWGEASQGEALFDVTHARAEPFGDGLDAPAVISEAREGFHFVHRVHGDALDILGKRRFRAQFWLDDRAGRREIARQLALLDEQPERRQPARSGDYRVAAIFRAHDGEILQEAMCGDRSGERLDIRTLVGAAHIVFVHDEFADRDEAGALRLGGVENFVCHGIAPEGERRTPRSAGAARRDLFPPGPRLKPAGSRALERQRPSTRTAARAMCGGRGAWPRLIRVRSQQRKGGRRERLNRKWALVGT